MRCLVFFRITSMKEDTSGQLSGRGELHRGARVITPSYIEEVYFKL